jgi:hypothetical protein
VDSRVEVDTSVAVPGPTAYLLAMGELRRGGGREERGRARERQGMRRREHR